MDSNDLISMLQQNKGALLKLMSSREGQQMISLMEKAGGKQQLHAAAQKAATGNTADLAAMVSSIMESREGAALAEKLKRAVE